MPSTTPSPRRTGAASAAAVRAPRRLRARTAPRGPRRSSKSTVLAPSQLRTCRKTPSRSTSASTRGARRSSTSTKSTRASAFLWASSTSSSRSASMAWATSTSSCVPSGSPMPAPSSSRRCWRWSSASKSSRSRRRAAAGSTCRGASTWAPWLCCRPPSACPWISGFSLIPRRSRCAGSSSSWPTSCSSSTRCAFWKLCFQTISSLGWAKGWVPLGCPRASTRCPRPSTTCCTSWAHPASCSPASTTSCAKSRRAARARTRRSPAAPPSKPAPTSTTTARTTATPTRRRRPLPRPTPCSPGRWSL
mmetsp:Transcript_154032/g.493770  ORF Transcript_154032/g.493770 Transcript_154032/m.493770 type:complete len:305 (+) Transcript_154032:647-1561(+)